MPRQLFLSTKETVVRILEMTPHDHGNVCTTLVLCVRDVRRTRYLAELLPPGMTYDWYLSTSQNIYWLIANLRPSNGTLDKAENYGITPVSVHLRYRRHDRSNSKGARHNARYRRNKFRL